MRLKRHGLRAAGILLMFACYVMAVKSHGEMTAGDNGSATAVLQDQGIDAQAAEEVQKLEKKQKEPVTFTLWGEKEQVQLVNKALQRKSIAAAISVCGSPQLLFQGTAVLGTEDRTGCLLDARTAQELFGSADIVGQKIYCQERELTVRGILKEERQVVVFQADSKDAGLDQLTVRIPQNALAESVVNSLLVRHGLDGQLMDTGLLKGISRVLILILPLCFAVALIVSFLKFAVKERGHGLSSSVCWAGAAVVLLISVWGMSRFLTIPKDMIPTKWSDFGFWTQLFKSKEEAFLFLIQSAKKQPQIDMVLAFFRSVGYSVLSVIFYFLTFGRKFTDCTDAKADGISEK